MPGELGRHLFDDLVVEFDVLQVQEGDALLPGQDLQEFFLADKAQTDERLAEELLALLMFRHRPGQLLLGDELLFNQYFADPD